MYILYSEHHFLQRQNSLPGPCTLKETVETVENDRSVVGGFGLHDRNPALTTNTSQLPPAEAAAY